MKNYKLNLKKEDLLGSKFDAREWTNEMKTTFQKAMFEIGITWPFNGSVVVHFDKNFYYARDRVLTFGGSLAVFTKEPCTLLTFDELFSPVETPSESLSAPLSEEFPLPEYTYTKCTFMKASEALSAFEEGEELYYKEGSYYYPCEDLDVVYGVYKQTHLYHKVSTPWYETVCEDKPIYITTEYIPLLKVDKIFSCPTEGYYLRNEEHSINIHIDECTPLTPYQVDDIVQTMKLWEK